MRKPQRTESCTRKRAFRHGSENRRQEDKTDGVAPATGEHKVIVIAEPRESGAEQRQRLSWAQSQPRGFTPHHYSPFQSSLGLCPGHRALKGPSAQSFFHPGRGDRADGPLERWRGGRRGTQTPGSRAVSSSRQGTGKPGQEDYTTRSVPISSYDSKTKFI